MTPANSHLFQPQLLWGTVMHRRLRPVEHGFHYPVFFIQLPLRQAAAHEHNRLFAFNRKGWLSVHARDHGPRDGSDLWQWAQGELAARGWPTGGEIVLQTFPRVLGYAFNPVSFWFCHDTAGQLVAVLAEVNNTFGDHHAYWLRVQVPLSMGHGSGLQADKAFHVSPFCQVQGHYRFWFGTQSQTPWSRIDYHDDQGRLMITSISGKSHGWSPSVLTKALLRMPLLGLSVMGRIHWQALRLLVRRVPFYGARPT